MIAGLCLFVVLISGCSNQPSVGLVDMEKVIQESPKVKLLQEKLSAKEKEVTEKNTKKNKVARPKKWKNNNRCWPMNTVRCKNKLQMSLKVI